MSWNINAMGTKAGVRKAVEAAQHHGGPSPQFDAAKALILAEIDAMPDDKGVKIDAHGHHDSSYRNMKIELYSTNFYT